MFLELPPRDAKPRQRGMTCLLDSGLPAGLFADALRSAHPFIDLVKFGWGTGLVSPMLEEKLQVLRNYEVGFWFGGTLFELAYLQRSLDDLVQWVQKQGTRYFEVSDGTISLPHATKLSIIRELRSEMLVLSEVGRKDARKRMSPERWIGAIESELEAGAWKVIAEGRESGTAGIYRQDGAVCEDLLRNFLAATVDVGDLLFEAPQKSQQLWLIRNVGRDVNLANVPFEGVVNVETLRLGLRSDVLDMRAAR